MSSVEQLAQNAVEPGWRKPRASRSAAASSSKQPKFDSVESLAHHVLGRARGLFALEKYADAAAAFTQCMALTEKYADDVEYLEWSGAIVHNIASCYHHMGELDVALMYYDFAARDFKKALKLTSGGLGVTSINRRRLQFVNQRLDDIQCSRPPNKDTYLDSSGQRCTVVSDEQAETAAAKAAEDLCSRAATAPLQTIPNALVQLPASCERDALKVDLHYFSDGEAGWFFRPNAVRRPRGTWPGTGQPTGS
jgi:tetratricopeptide (TPR) repeat protein